MWNRDSIALWVAFGVAVFGYLGSAGDPRAWGYADWIQAGSFVMVWLAGKLQTSPLPGKGEGR